MYNNLAATRPILPTLNPTPLPPPSPPPPRLSRQGEEKNVRG